MDNDRRRLINHEYQCESTDLLLPKSHYLEDLNQAAKDDNLEFIEEFLIRHRPHDINLVCDLEGATLLHIASGYGRHSVVDYLIRRNIDVNSKDVHGTGALSYAAAHGRIRIAKKLIRAGADVNLADDRLYTPLHYAVKNGHWRTIKLLLHSGAKPEAKSIRNKDCFARAEELRDIGPKLRDFIRTHRLAYKFRISIEHNSKMDMDKCLNDMNKYGAAIDRVKILFDPSPLVDESDDSSLLMSAIKSLTPTELVTLINRLDLPYPALVEAYFKILLQGDDQLETIQFLTEPQLLHAKLRSYDCITPLHRAAGRNYLEIANYLLEQQADPNATDANGAIPLHNAAYFGHLEMGELLIRYESDVNKADNKGSTPLHYASERSKTQLGELLITSGADIDKADRNGSTPLHYASRESKIQMCNLLVESGASLNSRDVYGQTPYDVATAIEIKAFLSRAGEALPAWTNNKDEIYLHFDDIQLYQNHILSDDADDPALEPEHCESDDRLLMMHTESVAYRISDPSRRDKAWLKLIPPTDKKHRIIVNRMHETIVKHDEGATFSHYNIIRICEILNEKLYRDYKHRHQKIKDENNGNANERILFHGSPHVGSVIRYGFDERHASSGGMFGAGLYFALHSSKSNQYTFGLNSPCKEHSDKSCYICVRRLFYCQVALGKTLKVTDVSKFAHAPPVHHSVSALPEILGEDKLAYPEYIIYRGEQAYPLYLIDYTLAR